MERLPQELNNQIFQKLKSIVEVQRMSPDELFAYEQSLSAERDLYACMDMKLQEGRTEGRKEERFTIAINLKKQGIPTAVIMTSTGLSSEDIACL